MTSKLSTIILVVLTIVLSFTQSASAKEWTINERQDQLMKDINAAQKKGDLTEKEAKKLRSNLADVARNEAKFRSKSVKGTITDEQRAKLEKSLNTVSVDIKRLALEKRVESVKEQAAAKKEAAKESAKKAKSK